MAATALSGVSGQTILVKSFQTDANGVQSNTPVVWSSSDATKAIVQGVYNSNNAVINCIAAGTATITATMGVVTATFVLTISASAAPGAGASLVVEADSAFQPVNKTIQTKV